MQRVYVNEKWCLGCHLCEYFCNYFDYDLDELMNSPFTVAMPDSKTPYRQMYVAN